MTEQSVDEILNDYVNVDSEEVRAMNDIQEMLEIKQEEYDSLKEVAKHMMEENSKLIVEKEGFEAELADLKENYMA